MRAGKAYAAARWEIPRLLNPELPHRWVYFAAPDEKAAAFQMEMFYAALNDMLGWFVVPTT